MFFCCIFSHRPSEFWIQCVHLWSLKWISGVQHFEWIALTRTLAFVACAEETYWCHCLPGNRDRKMSWRFVPKTGLNVSHKLMLLVFVATPVKLILLRDEVTLVVDSVLSCTHFPDILCDITKWSNAKFYTDVYLEIFWPVILLKKKRL